MDKIDLDIIKESIDKNPLSNETSENIEKRNETLVGELVGENKRLHEELKKETM